MAANAEANAMTGRVGKFAATAMRAEMTPIVTSMLRVKRQAQATYSMRANVILKCYSASRVSILA
jgi:hypothetical protein